MTSLLLVLAACKTGGDGFQPYYDGTPPTVSDLDIESEPGNAGGRTIAISGSGFGDDPTDVVVILGNHNAEVVDVADGVVTVTTPRGPITGGPVDLVVA